MPNVDGNFGEDVYNSFMRYFNDEVLSAFYKEMCVYWLKENINSILMDYIDTKDLSYNNVKMDNFACEKKSGRYMLITIRLPAENLHKNSEQRSVCAETENGTQRADIVLARIAKIIR